MHKYQIGDKVSTRRSYGETLVKLGAKYPNLIVLDAGTGNSTYTDLFKTAFPKQFLEMYIAEQNMIGVGVGLAKRGKIPFMSTFAAFLTRAHDQIRMAAYSEANIKIAGSHAGVSIGVDGASQMALEDIAMFRSTLNSIIFYPCDAVATEKLTEWALKHVGMVYLRLTRAETPVIYSDTEDFGMGGSKTLTINSDDKLTIVTAGITLFEALSAAKILEQEKIKVRVIDLYCIKPIDKVTLVKAARETGHILTVEDHYPEGGLGEAVRSVLHNEMAKVESLAVYKPPQSGKPQELLAYEEIDATAIVKKCHAILKH